jgi:membrane-associated phospholipid phosphatase
MLSPPRALMALAMLLSSFSAATAFAEAPSPEREHAAEASAAVAAAREPNGPGWAFGSPAAEVALSAASLASLAAFAIPQQRSSWGPTAEAPSNATLGLISDFTGSYAGTGLAMLGGLGFEVAYYRAQGDPSPWVRALRSSLVEAEAVAMTSGTTLALKSITGRCRPRAWGNGTCGGGEYDAFPSGHTSVISAVAGARFVNAMRSPGNATARFVSFGIAEAASLVTGALRVGAGAHSWNDVLGGYVLGHGIGALMALAHPWRPSDLPGTTIPLRELEGAARPTELPISVPTAPTIAGSWTFHF